MNYPFRSATLDYLHGADVTAVADALMQICEHYPAPGAELCDEFPVHPRHRARHHGDCGRALQRP